MRLKITDIPDEGLTDEFDLPVEVRDGGVSDTAHVVINVKRFGKKVLAEGKVNITVSLNCSRCLKPVPYPIETKFSEEYNPAMDLDKEEEQELTEGELDLSYYSNDELNISELIREQVLLSVPMKPLCSADCHGICLKCGKDLNEGACLCKTEEIDPRLAPLGKFKELMKDRGTA
ncbi:MAG: DUF177 domain-containing protein [Nitrospirae bacterium]|nr:DUF177 domain-containing protein [Nitrospirota bacterium]